MRGFLVAASAAIVPTCVAADGPPDFLESVTWGSAALCAPDARLTNETQIEAYSGPVTLIYLDAFGISYVKEPRFCSFQSFEAGLLRDEGVVTARLVCSGLGGFDAVMTVALIHTPESVGDSTPVLRLLDQGATLTQDLYQCPSLEAETQ